MGRKPNPQTQPEEVKSVTFNLQNYFKNCKLKGLEDATVLSESRFSNVNEWVSTGSYSFNKVISGDIHKGLARGRIYSFAGPSGVGKTYLMMSAAREAQKKGYHVIVFDSENAFNADSFKRIGGDPTTVGCIPVIKISELRNICIQMMDDIIKQNPETKLFIILDSIGGLLTDKVFEDIEENKFTSDMGQRAKQLRELAKLLTNYIGKYQGIMLASNHTYEQPPPNPKMPPVVKFGGGEGFIYATSGIVFIKKSGIKEEEKDAQGNDIKVKKGNILKITAEKNRFVPEGSNGEIYLSFDKGMDKWYGLLNDAMEAKLIIEPSQGWYEFTHNNTKVRKKDLYRAVNWQGIVDKLAEYIRSKYKYVSFVEDSDLEMLDSEKSTDNSSESNLEEK